MQVTFPNISFCARSTNSILDPIKRKSAEKFVTLTLPEKVTEKVIENPQRESLYGVTPLIYPIKYVEKYVNKDVVENALNTNPEIKKIMNRYKIKPKVYEKNIDQHTKIHLLTTYLYAKRISECVELNSKQKTALYQAALLHDIGKALIPDAIVQKPSRLNLKERDIMGLHARLGYEILKTTDIPEDVKQAVRTHHLPVEEKEDDIVSQILSVADVYSALREERVYKKALPAEIALAIMTDSPRLAQNYVDILKRIKHIA